MAGTMRTGVLMILIPVGVVSAVGGCIDERTPRKVVSVDGRIASVEPARSVTTVTGDLGWIGITYQSDRESGEITERAVILRQTEIVINGVLSRFSDLRAGDNMHGEFRVERHGDAKRYVALTIYVDR